jgi:hypothetical protein
LTVAIESTINKTLSYHFIGFNSLNIYWWWFKPNEKQIKAENFEFHAVGKAIISAIGLLTS